jgi:hypothetical protein
VYRCRLALVLVVILRVLWCIVFVCMCVCMYVSIRVCVCVNLFHWLCTLHYNCVILHAIATHIVIYHGDVLCLHNLKIRLVTRYFL